MDTVGGGEVRTRRGSGWRRGKSHNVLPGGVDQALHLAIMTSNTKKAEELLAGKRRSRLNTSTGGYDLAALDGEGLTVLHQAVFAANLPLLDVLVRSGGNVNACDEEGCTLLHAAAMVGNCLLAGWLIKEGANVMAIDDDGDLPIDQADDVGMQELLLQAMHRAGFVGLALHYQARLQATDEDDSDEDSDYGTACGSMSSFSDYELSLQGWREEADLISPGDISQVSCPDHVLSGVARNDAEQHLVLQEETRECDTQEFPCELSPVEEIIQPVHVPVSELACVESLAAARSGIAAASTFLDLILKPKPHLQRLRSSLDQVVQELRQSAASHEHLLVKTPTNGEASKKQENMNSRTQPIALLDDNRLGGTSKRRALRRNHTVSETDFGFVDGSSQASSGRGKKGLLRHSSLSDRSIRRHSKRKSVSFPVEVLLTDAISEGNFEETRDLLRSAQLQVNALLPSGLTPLHLAVLNRQRSIVQLLLTNGASVDCSDADGWKPLHAAAREGTVPITNTLLEFGADPLALTDDGKTARALASNDNVRAALTNAMERALKPMRTTPDCSLAEDFTDGRVEPHNISLRSASRYTAPSPPGTKAVSFSPSVLLRQAIEDGDSGEVDELLTSHSESNLALNCTDLAGVTALHQAVLDEKVQVVRFLLNDKRVNIHVRDADGWTAMHAAAAIGSPQIVELLIAAGASVKAPTTDGQTPSQLTDSAEVKAVLRAKQASSNKHCTVSDL